MVKKVLNGKRISTTVEESKFGTMHFIKSVSNGIETTITLFTDGAVLIHTCNHVVIYDEDVTSIDENVGTAGKYKNYYFKEQKEQVN